MNEMRKYINLMESAIQESEDNEFEVGALSIGVYDDYDDVNVKGIETPALIIHIMDKVDAANALQRKLDFGINQEEYNELQEELTHSVNQVLKQKRVGKTRDIKYVKLNIDIDESIDRKLINYLVNSTHLNNYDVIGRENEGYENYIFHVNII